MDPKNVWSFLTTPSRSTSASLYLHFHRGTHKGKMYATLSREVLFDYLKGRWSQEDIQKYIKFSTVVRDVVYNKATDDFTVSVKDLKNDEVIDGERYKIIMLDG